MFLAGLLATLLSFQTFPAVPRAPFVATPPDVVDRMLALAKPWQPYRTIGSWYLWRYLDAAPEDY